MLLDVFGTLVTYAYIVDYQQLYVDYLGMEVPVCRLVYEGEFSVGPSIWWRTCEEVAAEVSRQLQQLRRSQ